MPRGGPAPRSGAALRVRRVRGGGEGAAADPRGRLAFGDGTDTAARAFVEELRANGGPEDVEIIAVPKIEYPNKSNGGVFEDHPEEREQELKRLRAEIMAGRGPDVFLIATDEEHADPLFHMADMQMEQNVFYPLDDLLPKAKFMDWDALDPIIMAAGRSEKYGQLILPLSYTVRASAFPAEEAAHTPGANLTWADVCADGSGLLQTAASYSLVQWDPASVFGKLYDPVSRSLLLSEEEIYETLIEFRDLDARVNASDGMVPANGRVGMGFDSFDREEGVSDDWTFVLTYSLQGGVTAVIRQYGAINANTKRPEDAFFVLDYLLGEGAQASYSATTQIGADTFAFPVYGNCMTEESPARINGKQWFMSPTTRESFLALKESITQAEFQNAVDMEFSSLFRTCVKGVWERGEQISSMTDDAIRDAVHEGYQKLQMLLSE